MCWAIRGSVATTRSILWWGILCWAGRNTYTFSRRTKPRLTIPHWMEHWRHNLFRNNNGVSLYLIFTFKGCTAHCKMCCITHTTSRIFSEPKGRSISVGIWFVWRVPDRNGMSHNFSLIIPKQDLLYFGDRDRESRGHYRYRFPNLWVPLSKCGYVKWQEYIMYSCNRSDLLPSIMELWTNSFNMSALLIVIVISAL